VQQALSQPHLADVLLVHTWSIDPSMCPTFRCSMDMLDIASRREFSAFKRVTH